MQSLDILIGLVTVYLILGLAVTAIVEGIASYLDVRSRNLESALVTEPVRIFVFEAYHAPRKEHV